MSQGEHIAGLPVLGLILTALATGAVSYQALKKQFPESKPEARLGPKRVVINRVPASTTTQDEPPADISIPAAKLASARRMLLQTVCHLNPQSQTAELVNAVAAGRFMELDGLRKSAGVGAVYDSVKNSSSPADYTAQHQACNTLAAHPFYSEVTSVLAAGDFACAAPTFFKQASRMSEESVSRLIIAGAALSDRVSNCIFSK